MARIFICDQETGLNKQALLYSHKEWRNIIDQIEMENIGQKIDLSRMQELEKCRDMSKNMSEAWENEHVVKRKSGFHFKGPSKAELNKLQYQKYLALKREEQEKREKLLRRVDEAHFLETDEAKNLNIALRYSEILRERQMQLDFNKHLKKTIAEQEKDYAKSVQLDIENYKKQKAEEKLRKHAAQENLKTEFKQILNNAREKKLREKKTQQEEELKELEQIKKELEKIRSAEQKEIKRKQNVLKHATAENKYLHELFIKRRRDENDEESTAIHVISEAKKKIDSLRKKKELELQAEKITWRGKMTALVAAQLTKKVNEDNEQEEDRIKRAQKEKEEMLMMSKMKKKEHEQKKIDEIKKQYNEVLQSEKKRKEDNSVKLKWASEHRAKVKELDQYFNNRLVLEKTNMIKKNQEAWQKQIVENNAKIENEKKMEVSVLINEKSKTKIGNQCFLQYAEQLINECKEKGRPLHPLQKCLNDFKTQHGLQKQKPRPSIWESNVPICTSVSQP